VTDIWYVTGDHDQVLHVGARTMASYAAFERRGRRSDRKRRRAMFRIVAATASLAFAIWFLASPTFAAPSPKQRAQAYVAGFATTDHFSGVILVAKDGKPVFRKAFGLANREWGIPNTPEGKFRLGSITKQFTATAILQLQEAGKLSVDDPIAKYYPDAPAAWKAVTLRHLLTHTSGIPSYTALPGFFIGEARLDRTPQQIIELTRDKPLEFEPGTRFSYDNTGYIILGYVIEKVSGERYADYVAKHIFQPLGMASSGYDVSETIVPQRVAGYVRGSAGFTNAPYLSMTEPYAAGSLYSTADDMLIWDHALYAARPLSAASLAAMFTDYGHGYGFGWEIGKLQGHRRVGHSGGVNGFVTHFDRYPDDRLTVIVLSNASDSPVERIAANLGAIYLGLPSRAPSPGGEALIRREIDSTMAGTPDYDHMIAQLAETTRANLPGIQKQFTALGPIQSVTLESADPDDFDYYKVTFAHGALEWVLTEPAGGKLTVTAVRLAQ
jgi:CubicO group peptidase (beta-lactamase class C family)